MSDLTPLQKAQKKRAEMKAAGIEIVQLNPIEKSKKNPKSLRMAINGKCFDCANQSIAEIRNCPMEDSCTLWYVRPYQVKESKDE